MVIETKVDFNPTLKQLTDAVMSLDRNELADFFYEIFVNYGWDEKDVAMRINDYIGDLDVMEYKLQVMLDTIRGK